MLQAPHSHTACSVSESSSGSYPGTMTAVWWENQIDSDIVFGIPQVGTWSTDEEHFIENHQIEPDILVYNDPASVLAGRDLQLERAVEEMLKTISK